MLNSINSRASPFLDRALALALRPVGPVPDIGALRTPALLSSAEIGLRRSLSVDALLPTGELICIVTRHKVFLDRFKWTRRFENTDTRHVSINDLYNTFSQNRLIINSLCINENDIIMRYCNN